MTHRDDTRASAERARLEALRALPPDAGAALAGAYIARGVRVAAMRAGVDPSRVHAGRVAATVAHRDPARVEAFLHAGACATTGHDGADATAAYLTRAVRAEDSAAVRYADRPNVTGALVRVAGKVAVRAGGGGENPAQGSAGRAPGEASADAAARDVAQACAAVRDAVRTFRTAKNGAARDHARRTIRGLLHRYGPPVAEAARAAGWRD